MQLLSNRLSDLLEVGSYLWQQVIQRIVAVPNEVVQAIDSDDFSLRMIVTSLALLLTAGIAKLPVASLAQAE